MNRLRNDYLVVGEVNIVATYVNEFLGKRYLKDNSRTVYSAIVARDIAKNVRLRIIATNEDTERHLKEMGTPRTAIM